MSEWEYQDFGGCPLKSTTTTRIVNALKKSGIPSDIQKILDTVTEGKNKRDKIEIAIKRGAMQILKGIGWIE